MTSGDVTIQYIKKNHPGASVYLLGTSALKNSFAEAGIELIQNEAKPDIVVAGFDMTLTYEKLERACTYIREGAIFLASHPDINCPTEEGFIPDCGAICAAITLSTKVEPKYLGKPYASTLDYVLQITGEKKEQIAFVGDRIYTDVATGVKNGAKGILVLSGETTMDIVQKSEIKPDAIFASIAEMATFL